MVHSILTAILYAMWLGKGITDQDRNIRENQILLLGFFRSAAPFLSSGPVPSVQGSGNRAMRKESTRTVDVSDDDDMMSSSNHAITRQEGGTRCRGTLLVTLRNVHPYTDW